MWDKGFPVNPTNMEDVVCLGKMGVRGELADAMFIEEGH